MYLCVWVKNNTDNNLCPEEFYLGEYFIYLWFLEYFTEREEFFRQYTKKFNI